MVRNIFSRLSFLLFYILKASPIAVCALLSDNIPVQYAFNKAILDNIVGHAFISFFVWLAVLDYRHVFEKRSRILELILSFCVGSIIDLDHFLMARSLHLKDAVSLGSRPPFHSSSIIIILIFFQVLLRCGYADYYQYNTIQRLLLLFETSIISHHLRDAHRRGLWLWPIGSTPPIQPYWVYIFLITLLPFTVQKILLNIERTTETTKQEIV